MDTKNMIISNAKVIQKNETRINQIHPHKRKLLNFKIHKNKRNTLYNGRGRCHDTFQTSSSYRLIDIEGNGRTVENY